MFKLSGLLIITILFQNIVCESGICSWYGDPSIDGALTASGEPFNENALTAAHKTLAFGTNVRVNCNGKSVTVRINDRGPFVAGRILDLSRAAAQVLGYIDQGLCKCTGTKV